MGNTFAAASPAALAQAAWPSLLQHSTALTHGWQAGLKASSAGGCTTRCFATHFERKAAANPGLKYWKPTSPGQRGRVTVRRTGVWRGGPKRCLTQGAAKTGGRNHSGRITMWHRGGGARKMLRNVDFVRRPNTHASTGVVERIEYDPGRTAYIALVRHQLPNARKETRALAERAAALRPAASGGGGKTSSGSSGSSSSSSSKRGGDAAYRRAVADLLERLKADQHAARMASRGGAAAPRPFSYIVAPQELRPGDAVSAAEGAAVRPGNTLKLRDIPVGASLHNLEMRPGQGAALCRAAGCAASIVNKQETHATIALPSGEHRLFSMECRATVGAVSNPQHQNIVIGKAGYARHMGRRPIVRGVAMNPVDHPHGGGTAGGRPSVTPWGIPCKGHRTRKNSPMAKWILVPRRRGKQAGGGASAGGGQ
ncbi:50S ribosomal protein L2 [Monoraphidium neglectum]|uniref:Large ribosomal subunit protein uL2m n=1 Tax=Monoraphidium neglectum TaxID=145388 RepID=A0A0D2N3R5_9CHLO|nr:50S ribosomal protein L2 [Monoraphidium neglectum]KIZ00706.1 50S ribosomal protein L2 [Monoraphidium neglectum]|eukprot:XP_013899725.1 50S ribosomal protein L2 [Monoraphidium neglectum]